jgi:hypothetical protein
MEQIVIQIQDHYKAKMLFELLTALDFVKIVKTSAQADEENQILAQDGGTDFFSCAGLWANRDISLQSLRQQAWPRQCT